MNISNKYHNLYVYTKVFLYINQVEIKKPLGDTKGFTQFGYKDVIVIRDKLMWSKFTSFEPSLQSPYYKLRLIPSILFLSSFELSPVFIILFFTKFKINVGTVLFLIHN